MIRLEGLSPLQQELCDLLWKLDTTEELLEFYSQLPATLRGHCDVLMRMILIETLDSECTLPEHCGQAASLLEEFRLKKP